MTGAGGGVASDGRTDYSSWHRRCENGRIGFTAIYADY
jgi:hypothetical protein